MLCEKPCGLDTAQAQVCAAAADRQAVLLQVAYWRRFVPELAALRQQIRAGELGRILAVGLGSGTRPRPVRGSAAPAAASSPTWACTSSTRSAG